MTRQNVNSLLSCINFDTIRAGIDGLLVYLIDKGETTTRIIRLKNGPVGFLLEKQTSGRLSIVTVYVYVAGHMYVTTIDGLIERNSPAITLINYMLAAIIAVQNPTVIRTLDQIIDDACLTYFKAHQK